MFKFLNFKSKKSDQMASIKEETDAVLCALASKQADLYAASEKAMQRELKERKS